MRRLLVLVVVLAVLVPACSREGQGGGEGTHEPPEASPEEVAPLTGLPVEEDTNLDRPVVATKIDNNARARPQEGLGEADIVVTEVVEGGLTRFIALFHSVDPGEVGPVRSARVVDTKLLPAFTPAFAFSGAAEPTWETLRESELNTFADDVPQQSEAAGFERRSDRPRPHNLFVPVERLWELGRELPSAEQPWGFDPDPPRGGTKATAFSIAYSPSDESAWRWDAGDERWLRAQGGGEHVDASGRNLGAENVVVVRTEDPKGESVIGRGDAMLFRNGRAYEARWRKATVDSHFEWMTADGEALDLQPGRTWIEIVPQNGALEVATPSDDG